MRNFVPVSLMIMTSLLEDGDIDTSMPLKTWCLTHPPSSSDLMDLTVYARTLNPPTSYPPVAHGRSRASILIDMFASPFFMNFKERACIISRNEFYVNIYKNSDLNSCLEFRVLGFEGQAEIFKIPEQIAPTMHDNSKGTLLS